MSSAPSPAPAAQRGGSADPSGSMLGGAAAGALGGAAAAYALTEGQMAAFEARAEALFAQLGAEQDARLAGALDALMPTFEARVEAAGSAAEAQLVAVGEAQVAALEAAAAQAKDTIDAHAEARSAELSDLAHQLENALRALADDLTAALSHQSSEAEEALRARAEAAVHELDARSSEAQRQVTDLSQDLAGDLQRAADGHGDRLRHEGEDAAVGVRRVAERACEDVSEAGHQVSREVDDHRGRLRDQKARMRGAVEDVVQAILSTVPGVGPLLAHVADNIDPYDD
jgi:hypothetical protein